MHGNLIGILFFVAGIIGLVPGDTRIAWALVMIAGLLMVIGVGGL